MTRLAATALACWLLTPCHAAQPASEPTTDIRMPIVLAMPAGCTLDKIPALTICTLPDGYAARVLQEMDRHTGQIPIWLGIEPEAAMYAHMLDEATDRSAGGMSPCDDRETVALVSIAAQARPIDMVRNGAGFTIHVEALQPRLVRHDEPEIPLRQVFAVSLGRLAAGMYRCDLSVTWREPVTNGPEFYGTSRLASGGAPFAVRGKNDANHEAAASSLPSLADDDVKTLETRASKPGQPLWQVPRCESRPLAENSLAAVGLMGVGGVDLGTLGKDPIAMPVIAPVDTTGATKGTLMAVIAGPTLMSGEWLRVRSVDMALSTYTITIESWRDTDVRDRNVPHREILLVPLELPEGGLKQAPRVKVAWRELVADQAGHPYVLSKPKASAEPQPAIRLTPAPDHARYSAPPDHGQRAVPPKDPEATDQNDF